MTEESSQRPDDMVILFDVDNTLMDNDRVRELLETALSDTLGMEPARRFWELYEQIRETTGIVDFPASIARFRAGQPELPGIVHLEQLIFGFGFAGVVYEHSQAALAHAHTLGRPVIMSDGDQRFQRHKIRAAGIESAVDGNVLVFDHKELRLAEMIERFPAGHYVMIDDKPRILVSLKDQLGTRITTVMVCQGKYAHDPAHHNFPGADITIEGIGGFLELDAPLLLKAAGHAQPGGLSHSGERSQPREHTACARRRLRPLPVLGHALERPMQPRAEFRRASHLETPVQAAGTYGGRREPLGPVRSSTPVATPLSRPPATSKPTAPPS